MEWGDGQTSTFSPTSSEPLSLAHTYATAGNYTIVETVSEYDGGTATATAAISVTRQATSTSLTSSAASAVYGQSLTFTATVTGVGAPTGAVAFYAGPVTPADLIGSGTLILENGQDQATFSTTALSASGSPYAITAVYGGDADNQGSPSNVVSETITKANAVIMVTPYTVSYDGDPHTATGTATGVETPNPANLSGLLDLSGTTHTDAGTYTDTWTFAGDGNYNSASGTITDLITPPLTVTAIAAISPNPRTTPVSTVDVTFSLAIDTSSPTAGAVTLTDNGNPVAVSGVSFTLVSGTTSTYQVGDLSAFTAAAGSYTLTIDAADIDDQYGNSGTGSLSTSWLVNGTTPTISWANPANIVYGTALSGAQLDATANVPGTFTYTPAAGTVLGAGNQTLSVLFTPTDTTDYTSAVATATIDVLPATPTISWSNPANIVYGTALSGTQLDATSSWTVGGVSESVAGTFTYTPAAGIVLGAGNQTLSVVFTPTDMADYTTASATATINVLQATPAISWPNPANIVFGTALGGSQLDATSSWTVGGVSESVAGTFTYNLAAGTVLGAGNNQPLSVSFTPTDVADYTTASATGDQCTASNADDQLAQAGEHCLRHGARRIAVRCHLFLDSGRCEWERGGNVHLLVGGGHRSWRRQQPDALGRLYAHRHGRLHHRLRDGDDQCIASNADHQLAQSGEHCLRHGARRIAVGCHLFLDSGRCEWERGGNLHLLVGRGHRSGHGNNQPLSVSFTPTDVADYTTASATVTINVLQATPTISWANPANIVYGTALSGTQLDASSSWTIGGVSGSVAGTFTYTPAVGTVLGAGNNQTLSVSFTPADTSNYTTASATATINVLPATPTISWPNPADIVFGTALGSTQLDASSSWTVDGLNESVEGTYTYNLAAGTVLGAANNQPLTVVFAPTDTTDYTTASATVFINVLPATPTISWANPANIVYGTALSGTQLDASSSWTIGGVSGSVAGTFTYTPAVGTVLGAGNNQTLSVSFTPTDTSDFTTASTTATIDVLQATPTISWANPADIVYGMALSATQLDAASSWTVGGVSGSVPGSFTYTPAAGAVLGAGNNQTLSVSFTPADLADYTTASATATINVSQATPTISWANPADIVYGMALSATQLDAASSWTVGGVSGSVPGSFTYTPAAGAVLGAGNNQTLSVSFTPTDLADYTTASATATINVSQATPTISWANPADIVYGMALSATQLDAASSWTVGGVSGSVAGTFTYTPAAGTVLGAGNNQTLSVSFTPTDLADYTTASATATINVSQATPTISWANPADIIYGMALSATQLDAASSWTVGGVSGSVAGTFTYTPAAGTVLGAGTNQTLSVAFTPTDMADYTTASATATINVSQATPTISWSNPANIVYGTALSGTQLDATSSWTVGGVSGSVAGTFTYTPAAGTVLGAGNNQALSVLFTPTDTTDYTAGSATATINVLQATPTISCVNPVEHHLRHGVGGRPTDGYGHLGGERQPGKRGRRVQLYDGRGNGVVGRRRADGKRDLHAHRHDRLRRGHRHGDDQRIASDAGERLCGFRLRRRRARHGGHLD